MAKPKSIKYTYSYMHMNELIYVRYSRKSSESKEKQALSIRDQNKECEDYSIRENLKIKFKIQEEKSAFKPNRREQFNKMVELVKSGQANAILTWKPDRICRNPLEGGIILQLLQDGVLKEIRTPLGDIYTPEGDTLILQIHFGMANQYSRNLSQNVKRGLNRKVQDRKEYPRPAPLGYEGYGDRGKRNIQPLEHEAELVKKAFEMASTGLYSFSQIIETLQEKGFYTKKGRKISKSHLSNLLHSPTYYGYFMHNGELYEGNYAPIISKGLFELANEMLVDRSRPKKTIWDRDFAGLFKCGDCGCAITTTIKKKFLKNESRYAYYTYHHCTRRRGNCVQMPVGDVDFKQMLYEKVCQVSINQDVWQLGLKLVQAKHSEEVNKNKHRLQKVNQEREYLRDQLNTLVDMRMRKELTPSEFTEQKLRISIKSASLAGLSNDNDDSFKSWLELSEEYFNTAFQAQDVLENGTVEAKQILLKRIGGNFILRDKKIEITFKKPFDALLKQEYRTNVLRD